MINIGGTESFIRFLFFKRHNYLFEGSRNVVNDVVIIASVIRSGWVLGVFDLIGSFDPFVQAFDRFTCYSVVPIYCDYFAYYAGPYLAVFAKLTVFAASVERVAGY